MRRATVPLLYKQDDIYHSVATGTLFEVADRYFIITARHIFDGIEPEKLAYPEHSDGTVVRTIGISRLVRPDTDKIDVAVIEVLDSVTREKLLSGWQFLTLENLAPATNDGVFALMGYPSETSTRKGEWRPAAGIVYFSERICAPLDAPDLNPAIDLFFGFGSTAIRESREEVNAPDLAGTSGAAVWECGDLMGGLWAPTKILKIVGVQSAQWKKRYFRAVSWAAVASIFGQMDENLKIAIQQILETQPDLLPE
jgi:hypothetical protein